LFLPVHGEPETSTLLPPKTPLLPSFSSSRAMPGGTRAAEAWGSTCSEVMGGTERPHCHRRVWPAPRAAGHRCYFIEALDAGGVRKGMAAEFGRGLAEQRRRIGLNHRRCRI